MRLTGLLEKLTDTVHRDEVLRAQSRLRLEQLTEKVLADHGLGVDDLVNEYGPDVPVPPSAAETAEYEAARERGEDVVAPPPMPFDRAAQERRLKRAEKDLSDDTDRALKEAFGSFAETFTTSDGTILGKEAAAKPMDAGEVGQEKVQVRRAAPVKK